MLPDNSIELSGGGWLTPPSQETSLTRSEPSLHKLLMEAFDQMQAELDTNGNTLEFLRLRQSHGDTIKGWWASKRQAFLQGLESGERVDFAFEAWLKIGEDEFVTLHTAEEYMTDNPILTIKHRTSHEENEVTITSDDRGLDLFMYPPKITGKYKTDPEESWDYQWEVVFRGPAISTFTRARVHEDPNHRIPYIKQVRTIDASIFGIDNLGLYQALGIDPNS